MSEMCVTITGGGSGAVRVMLQRPAQLGASLKDLTNLPITPEKAEKDDVLLELDKMNNLNMIFSSSTKDSSASSAENNESSQQKPAEQEKHTDKTVKSAPEPSRRRHEPLRCLINEATHSDVLHNQGQGLGCDTACKGSLLAQAAGRKFGVDRPRQQVIDHMTDFMRQYYEALKRVNSDDHKTRVAEALGDIECNGTYQLTSDELLWGSKQAWRNASRCIGRIQWNKLQLFDCRHVRTAREMYEALCVHLKYATNGGNIRSAITVFPQRSAGYHDYRVWNPLLIRYAGYTLPDGSVLGDPASVEFTNLCMKHGWTPPNNRSRFDVLPWLLQANGEDPQVFDIPQELALQVEIQHPKYKWFGDLGLKWYAVPGVSNMMLDCGGLEFTGCPFNGWYMGTEVGARNFSDSQRYNMLETVAKKLGLDTTNSSTLWKDQACVEINIAVLHSYQKKGVTITDHHSASESFMKHLSNEQRQRGGCPADWVWIVPPISGSLCPVFHQEMLNYKLYPSYEYQPDAWRFHQQSKRQAGALCRPKQSFKSVAVAAMFCSSFMRKIKSKRKKCTILYATETGKSETFANMLETIFSHLFDTKVECMEDYAFDALHNEQLLLCVASTFGSGDPPENGEAFFTSLKRCKQSLHTRLRHAVFALGSSAYPNFCAFGKNVDEHLSDLGARRLLPVREGDELCGQEDSFNEWAVEVFKEACKHFNIGDTQTMNSATKCFAAFDTSWHSGKYKLHSVKAKDLELQEALSIIHRRKVVLTKVTSNKNLQSSKSSRKTMLLEVDCKPHQEHLQYKPGDHVAVFPSNDPALVNKLLDRLSDVTSKRKVYQLQHQHQPHQGETYWTNHSRLPAASLRTVLTHYLDITSPPAQKLLGMLVHLTADSQEQARLNQLSASKPEYDSWKRRYCPGILDVLLQFPGIIMPVTFALTQLPLLQYRYYSISSSMDMYPAQIHATVAVVSYQPQDPTVASKPGLCSNWIANLTSGDVVPCFIRAAPNFHLPENVTQPIVMIGPGTGVAPYRSFWQQRRCQMKASKGKRGFGPMTLYGGCRRADHDHIYRKETKRYCEKGYLTKTYTAYSREPKIKKTYVQDLLVEHAETIAGVMVDERSQGHVYVCGDATMAGQVVETLHNILLRTQRAATHQQARQIFNKMKDEHRYHEDIFGTPLKSAVEHMEKQTPGHGSASSKQTPGHGSASSKQTPGHGSASSNTDNWTLKSIRL